MLVLILAWAIIANWFAYSKGFYRFPKGSASPKTSPYVSHLQLFTVFGLYILITILIVPYLAQGILSLLKKNNETLTNLPISVIATLQFSIMVLILVGLNLFLYKQDKTSLLKIWKNREKVPSSPIEFDLALGIIAWILSFPLVNILIDLVDTLLKSTFHLKDYEQNAVHFVKVAKDSPISLVLASLSVLILAPLIEEFLFRGVLQTYLKRLVGVKAAILLAALCFALFHFSPAQGLGNITLVLALLFLGGYLGFLYERQGSLWAPISLHLTFNAISAIRIIFFPEVSV